MQHTETFTTITANFFAKLDKNVNQSFLNYILNNLFIELKNGNTYIELNPIELTQILQYNNIVKHNQLAPLVIIDKNKLSIGKIWYIEKQIVNFFMSKKECNIKINNINKLNKTILDKFNLIIITGAPGTGKTFNVANILNILLEDYTLENIPQIAISAPTGKAATNIVNSLIEQSTNKPNLQKLQNIKAQTIHKLLNINPFSLINNDPQLNYDLIIIDEASMLDIILMYKLIKSINNNKTKLILLGDPNQLPPIGNIDLFSTIINCDLLINNTIKLTKNYRYKENSSIDKLAKLCLQEKICEQEIINCFQKHPKNIKIIQNFELNSLLSTWYENQHNYWESITNKDKSIAFKLIFNQILLSAFKKDVDELNNTYLKLVQQKQNILSSKNIFSGVPIIITKNDYHLNLYNGDIGIVFEEHQKLYVYFNINNEYQKFNINNLTNYDLAFALTVHKSQGCEYNHVIFLAPNYTHDDFNNNLKELNIFDKKMIYTAITRAKETFTYLGNLNSLLSAISKINTKKSTIQILINNINQKNT